MPAGEYVTRRELGRLLSALGVGHGQEALVPNSYSVDPAGNVNLSGINLPAGTTTTPPDQDRIRWLRQSDGAVVADISAFTVPGTGEALNLRAIARAAADQSEGNLLAIDDQGATQAGLLVNQSARGTVARVSALSGGHQAVMLAENNGSEFLRFAAGIEPYKLFVAQNVGVQFTAATKATETAIVHNLGAIPQVVAVLALGDPGIIFAPYYKNGGSATTISVGAYTTAAVTKNVPVSVLVLG